MRNHWIVLPLTAVCLAAPAYAREGFGFTKKAVTMQRTKPPGLAVSGTRVKVTAESERSDRSDDASTLRRYTEDALLDGRMAASTTPDFKVDVQLDRLDSHETWETKTVSEYKQTGTSREWNAKKNRYEDKAIYGNVDVEKQVKVVTGSIHGAYTIADGRGKVIDSGSIDQEFKQKYDDGKDSLPPEKVEDELLHRAAMTVAARLVPTTERVTVLLPKGSFESLIPLAESGQWDKYLAGVEAVHENRNADQEAYRQYALAVAKEAVAYQSDDIARALDLLRESAAHYQRAAQSNPNEKLFTEKYSGFLSVNAIPPGLPRAQESVTLYDAWRNAPRAHAAAGGSVASTARSATSSSSTTATSSHSRSAMSNQTVIDMVKAGLSDENIILAIDEADHTSFDTTPDSLIALSRAGVGKSVIAKMQKKKKG